MPHVTDLVAVIIPARPQEPFLADAVRSLPAVGVDVASGVEVGDTKPPRKDPLAVALFVKRARAARFDLPLTPSRPMNSRSHWIRSRARSRC